MNQSNIQQAINKVAQNFGVAIKIVNEIQGPSTILVEVETLGKTKVKDVLDMEEELAIAIKAHSVRCTLMSNRGTVGIEIATGRQEAVPFEFKNQPTMELPIFVGKDTTGTPIYKDLTKGPQTLLAGATGQGKSVFINALIASLLHSVNPVKFMMIDPKKVELTVFNDLAKRWFFPINGKYSTVTEASEAIEALTLLCDEMDMRYRMLQGVKARNVVEARSKGLDMPYVVCVIDEFADLIMVGGKSIEAKVVRLAQLGRACGIHIVLATQRPSSDIITGLIKANFPTRVAFRTASKVDSRVILDSQGAQALLGCGDMLWKSGVDLERIQGCFLSTEQVEELVRTNGEDVEVNEIVVEEPITVTSERPSELMSSAHEAIKHLKEYCEFHRIAFRVHLNLIMRKMKVDFAKACEIATEVRSITGI